MHSALIDSLRFPLQTASLLVIGCFSLLLTIAQMAGMLGIPLSLIIVSWFLKYSFVLLDSVVDGKREPPVLSAEMVNPVEQRPLGLLLLMIAFYSATMTLEPSLGEWGVRALRIGALLVVPAMVAAMSVTGRFVEALNPVAVFGTIARIPLAYALLLVTIGALWGLPFVLIKLAGIQNLLSGFFGQALLLYLWLAMCACIGRIIYEQREALGFEPAHSPERTHAREQRDVEHERDKMMDAIFAQVRGGAFANAGASVRALIENSPHPLVEFRWTYARSSQWPDQRLADYLVQLCLPRLIEAHATGEALDVIRARLRSNAEFRPLTSAQLLRVAMLARAAGDRSTARLLLTDFDRHFPRDAAAAMATKLSAELQR